MEADDKEEMVVADFVDGSTEMLNTIEDANEFVWDPGAEGIEAGEEIALDGVLEMTADGEVETA